MSDTVKKRGGENPTLRAAKAFSRRTLLQSAAAAGALTAGGPLMAKRALSSSGEVNVYAWSDYIWPDMIEAFEKDSGIKVNLSKYGSNDEVLTKLKTSGGKGFDLVFPSVTYGPAWYDAGDLLQPVDESKVAVDRVIPALWEKSADLGAVFRRKRYLVPYDWGTEAILYDSSKRDYKYGELSYGTLWEDDNKGLVTVRQKSALTAIGLYLDHIGEVPSNNMHDTYESEEKFRAVYDKSLAFAIEHKPWVRQFWNNTQETLNAFQQNNCVIGQCWDGPSLRLMSESDKKYRYLMPAEGGMTWLDTMGIPAGAENVEQAYAFVNHLLTPQMGGTFANQSGYNSAVKGAEEYLKPESKENFQLAYPGDAIEKLWWYPPEPAWWVAARSEYVDKWNAA